MQVSIQSCVFVYPSVVHVTLNIPCFISTQNCVAKSIYSFSELVFEIVTKQPFWIANSLWNFLYQIKSLLFITLFDSTSAFVECVYFFQLQELRKELDILLQEKIESPHPVDWKDTKSRDCAVLSAIIDLIKTQEKATPRNLPPRFQDGYYSWRVFSGALKSQFYSHLPSRFNFGPDAKP